MELRMIWNANFAADQPPGLQLNVCICVALIITGYAHRHQQRDLIVVTIIGQMSLLELLRMRPLNLSRAESGRKLPVQYWGLARIPWIDPVDVPVFLQGKMDSQQGFLARHK